MSWVNSAVAQKIYSTHLAHQEVDGALLGHVVPDHLQLKQGLSVALHGHQHVGAVEGSLVAKTATEDRSMGGGGGGVLIFMHGRSRTAIHNC